ncbi:MAG: DUF342 domain-containing protein [Spirochaetales bacterium]|nr:DUF342 domain-containing protein [Leptospiraceae bacterium]MCP5481067.1 DUF342 domain-containing protein [Spirochaetales bacterium]MCP5485447.1 DUF342 domain-containing protein [Spirochaetales bacterium]
MSSSREFLDHLEEGEKGHFTVERKNDRAILKVYPPGRRGEAVETIDVLKRLELFGLTGVDRALVEQIVVAADGQAHDVAHWPAPDVQPAGIKVHVSHDRMQAELEVTPPHHGGGWVSLEDLKRALAENGVTHGIDHAKLESIVNLTFQDERTRGRDGAAPIEPEVYLKKHGLRTVVARGRDPSPGQMGLVQHYFDPAPRAVPDPDREHADQRVDFRKLKVIQTCEAGQLLAELVDPVPGKPGQDVCGDSIAARPVEAATLFAGTNTRLAPDGRAIHAVISGQVRIDQRSAQHAGFEVEEVLNVGSVDYSTGHVDFPGTVTIQETVLDGFEVRAKGDIIIEKTVGRVRLEAGGDIFLSGGAVCRESGYIRAGGSVFARFIQDATVSVEKDLVVEEAIMNSRIVSGNEVVIEGGRGELIGGHVVCGHRLRAVKIGSRMETPTTITVGIAPEILERLSQLDAECDEKMRVLRKVNAQLRQMEEAARRGKEPAADEAEVREKLVLIRDRYDGLIRNLEQQREMIYATTEAAPDAEVIVLEMIYPAVEVHFGAQVKRYRVEGRPIEGYSRFVVDEGRIYLRHSNI